MGFVGGSKPKLQKQIRKLGEEKQDEQMRKKTVVEEENKMQESRG